MKKNIKVFITLLVIGVAFFSFHTITSAWKDEGPKTCEQSKDLGGLHIRSEYCTHNHLGHDAIIIPGTQAWACVSDDKQTTTPVDLDTVCKSQFPNVPSVHAVEDVPGDPNTYRCVDTSIVCSVSPTPTVEPSPEPTGEPSTTPEPTQTPTPPVITSSASVSDGGSSNSGATQAPTCTVGDTTQLPANTHVIRSGTEATVNFFITQGDSANIYWSVVGQPHWSNSSAQEFPDGVKPKADGFVSYIIHDLDANQGYDFGIEQKNGCGGGKVTAVVVDGPETRTFRVSYYEISK